MTERRRRRGRKRMKREGDRSESHTVHAYIEWKKMERTGSD